MSDAQHNESQPGHDSQAITAPLPETPLPKLALFIVFIVRVAEPITYLFIFPFINAYVWDLGVTNDRAQVGFYAGIIEGIFAISQLLTVLHWAKLSDRIGRRPVLIIGCAGLILSAALFGLADTFVMAVLARCLAGFLNGNVAILRSVVGELCDKTNVAKGFVLLPLAWNAGASAGPFIGGFLVFPAKQFPGLFGHPDAPFYLGGLWVRRPYFLPCLAVSCLSLLTLIVLIFALPETLPSKVAEQKRAKAAAEASRHGEDPERRPLLAHSGAQQTFEPEHGNGSTTRTDPQSVSESADPDSPTTASLGLLRIPHIRSVLISFAFLTFCSAGFDAVLVLFLYEPLNLGGLHFSSAQTGTYLGVFAIFSMIVQASTTPYLIRKLGSTRLYRCALLCFSIEALLLPLASAVARWGSDGHSGGEEDPLPTGTLVAVYFIMTIFGILRCCSAYGFASNLLLVNECAELVEGSHLAAVNAYSTMSSSLSRSVGPSFFTFLFSLSVAAPGKGGGAQLSFFRGWLIWAALFVSGVMAMWSTSWIKPIEVAVEEERRRREWRRREAASAREDAVRT